LATPGDTESRHRVVAALIQAGGPMTLPELAIVTEQPEERCLPPLNDLADASQVVSGRLAPDDPCVRYCWSATWSRNIEARLRELDVEFSPER